MLARNDQRPHWTKQCKGHKPDPDHKWAFGKSRADHLARQRKAPKIPASTIELAPFEPEPLGVDVLDLRTGMCRWPHGDPKRDFGGFCGRHARGGSYCPHHRARAYRHG